MNLDYNKLSEDEVLALVQKNDDEALNFILNKYKPIVKIKARMFFLIGGENDDLMQEGMIGLFNAINKYNEKISATFKTFAEICIENQMKTAIRNNTRQKHTILNDSIPIYDIEKTFASENNSPLNILLTRENYSILIENLNTDLTDLEKKVLDLYLDGKNRREIGLVVLKDEKSISNTLSRIRKKIIKIKGEIWKI